jgi:uncharacterized metal-binding protein YceD (DUF177 family)
MASEAPFSRKVRVDALPNEGLALTIEADADERAALAALCRLPAIAELAARFVLQRAGRAGVRVTGNVHAEFTQTCVVSLEPFAATLDEPVEARFAPPAAKSAARRGATRRRAEIVALDGEDPPDPIVDGAIDLGALAAEFLALGLDPYPRKPGASFAPPEPEGGAASPFAVLSEWTEKSRE